MTQHLASSSSTLQGMNQYNKEIMTVHAHVHCGPVHNSYDKDRSGCSTYEWIGK